MRPPAKQIRRRRKKAIRRIRNRENPERQKQTLRKRPLKRSLTRKTSPKKKKDDESQDADGEAEKKEKKEKKKKPKEETEDTEKKTAESEDASETSGTKKETEKDPEKKQKKKGDKDKKTKKGKEDDDGAWFSDTSKEAQEARRQAEIEEMKNISKAEAVLASSDNKIDDPVQLLRIFLSKKREVSEIVSELRRVQLARGLDDTQRLKILLEAFVNADEPAKVPTALSSQATVLKKFAVDKTSSGVLISCLEEMVGVTHPKLIPRTPHILQALYEADVLSEDAILSWADAPPEAAWTVKKEIAINVRSKATPFIEWLRNAEEENDGADDEEEEDES